MGKLIDKEIKLIYKSSVDGEHIKDWSPLPKGLRLPSKTYASIGMNNVSSEYMGLYMTERNEYHTSGIVGVGWLKRYDGKTVVDEITGQECAIMIKPRFSSMDPWSMLSKVLADKEYDDYVRECGEFYTFDTTQKLIPIPASENGGELLAALSFLKACERVCRRNLCRTMSFKEENFNGKVVGNINVAKHIKHNVISGREDRVYCRYPIFTIDTLENRIMKAALIKAHRIIQVNHNRSTEIQKIYSYCASSLKMVSNVKIIRSDFSKVKTTGCNAHYKNIMKLSHVILFNEGIYNLYNDSVEDTRLVIPYTINMEKLFEFYVRSIMKDYFRNDTDCIYKLDQYRNSRNALNVFGENTDSKRLYIMDSYIPDIAIYEENGTIKRYVAVFDVKYQHSTSKAYASTVRHNSHQLLFYMLLLNVNTCGFIFPKEDNAIECDDGTKLNIQNGNRIINSGDNDGYYTQWLIDLGEEKKQKVFASRMIEYIKKIDKKEK